jgi:hypothetical protein
MFISSAAGPTITIVVVPLVCARLAIQPPLPAPPRLFTRTKRLPHPFVVPPPGGLWLLRDLKQFILAFNSSRAAVPALPRVVNPLLYHQKYLCRNSQKL